MTIWLPDDVSALIVPFNRWLESASLLCLLSLGMLLWENSRIESWSFDKRLLVYSYIHVALYSLLRFYFLTPNTLDKLQENYLSLLVIVSFHCLMSS